MQDRVGPAGQDRLRIVPDRPPDEFRRGGHGVRVAGGQVVEHDHLVPGPGQEGSDHAADVAGASGDEQPHRASWDLMPASPGVISLVKASPTEHIR